MHASASAGPAGELFRHFTIILNPKLWCTLMEKPSSESRSWMHSCTGWNFGWNDKIKYNYNYYFNQNYNCYNNLIAY